MYFLIFKMSAKSNKIELSEELMVMREEQPPESPKFTGKHLCQSLFFNKVAGLADFLRTKNTSGWLLPKLDFFRLIFLNNVLFQMQNLYVFKLAWHWLADKQCCYSCLYDVLLLYRYLKTLQWCRVSTAVRGIS